MDPEVKTYSTQDVCNATGASFRQIDYWSRIGLVEPYKNGSGSGTRRLYDQSNVDLIRAIKACVDVGFGAHTRHPISETLGPVIDHVKEHGLTGKVTMGIVTVDLSRVNGDRV